MPNRAAAKPSVRERLLDAANELFYREGVQTVGIDRIMLGSDYCFDMGVERPRELLEQINLPGAQRKMILGENAARLLKL